MNIAAITIRSVAIAICIYGTLVTLQYIIFTVHTAIYGDAIFLGSRVFGIFQEALILICGLVIYRQEPKIVELIIKPQHSYPPEDVPGTGRALVWRLPSLMATSTR